MSSTRLRAWYFGLWCVAMLGAAAFFASQSTRPFWLESNVFKLLPASEYDALTERALHTVEREVERQLVILVGHRDRTAARTAADRIMVALAANPLIERVQGRLDQGQIADTGALYFAHRRQLLSQRQLDSLELDGGVAIEQSALATLFSPFGSLDSAALLADPFALFPESLRALQPPTSLKLEDGYLWASDGDIQYVFVAASTRDVSRMEQQRRLAADIAGLAADASGTPGVEVRATGFVLYANAAAQKARAELSTIGVGSLVGVVLLILFVFRSWRPLALGLLSIASGCVLALAVTLAIFGSIHLFTLVFGASLIGVSIDYTLHYLAQEGFDEPSSERALRRITPGITLGLITSVIAFLALMVAPFPGLKQLAAFSTAGLIGAYWTLFVGAGIRRRPLTLTRQSLWLRASARFLAGWRGLARAPRYGLVAGLAVVAAAGLTTLEFDDDVSMLQTQPEGLRRDESEITRIVGTAPSNAFVLVRAATTEAMLETEEVVRARLEGSIAAGSLSGYQAISRAVPSIAHQERSLRAYRRLVTTRLPSFFQDIGVATEQADAATAALLERAEPNLTLDDWLAHDISRPLRSLWLGAEGGEPASIVALEGLTNVAATRAALADLPGVRLIARAQELSSLFGAYRVRIAWLLVAAYASIYLFLAVRYGASRAVTVLLPPVLAGLLALAAVSLLNGPLNLFNLLGLILVLGIGIDFTLFIVEAEGHMETTMFAITLSAATTLLSFGLLALSSTHAVRSFGLVVLLGIAAAYLLAPFALGVRKPSA